MSLQANTQIGPYTIVALVGAGGMGEVYRAHDPRLKRDVAIKVLSPLLPKSAEMVARFEREAMAASALSHPNIVTIHDIGAAEVDGERVHYLAMELIDGETLTARLARARGGDSSMLEIVAQVADALGRAHAAGIVHRDLKPDNVMVTRDGLTKVLDFGLAKLVAQEIPAADADSRTAVKTRAGIVVGTAAYMSPEQARGAPVDHRSDIFSLGTILYEVLTGKRAWSGESLIDTLHQIIHDDPPSLSMVPAELQQIVRQCLAKDPDGRYQSARELAVDLRGALHGSGRVSGSPPAAPVLWWTKRRALVMLLGVVAISVILAMVAVRGRSLAEEIDALAVLPFRGAAGADSEALTDGIAESIINQLSHLSTPRVMARSTVFHYKASTIPPVDVGRKLGVDAIVTGQVTRRGDRLSVDVELVDVSDGSQLWGEHYERSFAEVLSLQREISLDLLRRLRRDVSDNEQRLLAREESTDPAAYELYLKGRHWWNKRSPAAARKAISYFQKAIDTDPAYARAWAGMADCYDILGAHGAMKPQEAFGRAKAAARQALAIDSNLAEPYASLGDALVHYDWDWPEAERNLRRSIELNPKYGTAYLWYSEVLIVMGRSDEGLEASKHARELEPLSIVFNTFLAKNFYYRGEYDAALAQARQTVEIEDSAIGRFETGKILTAMGRYEEAILEYDRAAALSPELDYTQTAAAWAYGLKGDRGEWERRMARLVELRRSRYVSAFQLAIASLGGSDKEQALAWLGTAVAERDSQAPFIALEPAFAPLRNDARFERLVRSIGVAPQRTIG